MEQILRHSLPGAPRGGSSHGWAVLMLPLGQYVIGPVRLLPFVRIRVAGRLKKCQFMT